MNGKKLAAYTVILLILGAAVFFQNELQTAKEAIQREPAQPVGAADIERVLSAVELAEVLTLRLELEIVADLADADEGTAAFYNERVRRSNELAAVPYREADLPQAMKRAERAREATARAALDGVLEAGLPEAARTDKTAARIWTAQALLRARGLYLSRPSGKMDGDTAYAVKMYQLQRGDPQTGAIDDTLTERLKDDYLYGKREVKIGV